MILVFARQQVLGRLGTTKEAGDMAVFIAAEATFSTGQVFLMVSLQSPQGLNHPDIESVFARRAVASLGSGSSWTWQAATLTPTTCPSSVDGGQVYDQPLTVCTALENN